jgi:hypothetical protein
MTAGHAPLAFVYDRCATRCQRHLDMRLMGCHAFADRKGWVLAGRWLDLGDYALRLERPQFAVLVSALRKASARRDVVCLVHNWGRLGADHEDRLVFQQRIAEAGGHVVTAFDESDARAPFVLAGRADA